MKSANRFAAMILTVASLAITSTSVQGQQEPTTNTTAKVQTLTVGTYRGTGPTPNGGQFQFDVVIERINPDGTLSGTNQHHAGYQACRSEMPLTGTVKDRVIQLHAPGSIKDCERTWELRFLPDGRPTERHAQGTQRRVQRDAEENELKTRRCRRQKAPVDCRALRRLIGNDALCM
jgi:hypothetical protein